MTCSSVRPVAGSVLINNVGALRAAAHAAQRSSCASSIQASARAGPA
jgi:hypothetical protein